MTDRLAILHLGVTKTGTSSIQAWLAGNRVPLAAAGIHVPDSLGRHNHERLARIADGSAPPKLAARFAEEMAALPPAAHTIVISSEAFGARLTTPEAVAPIKALLDRHAGSYRVVLYLRRQDEHAVSSFSTAMRSGEGRRTSPLGGRPKDYAALLDAWAAVFGRAAIHPRIFTRDALKDGDVVADFLATAGIPVPAGAMPPALQRNTSLRPEAQLFLARLAEHARRSGVVQEEFRAMPNWQRLIALLDSRYAGPGLLPARAEAEAFLARARDSNERVRRDWFPDRTTLFPEDFERYPDRASAPPGLDALLEVGMTTLLALLAGQADDAATPARTTADREARRAARREARTSTGAKGNRRQR